MNYDLSQIFSNPALLTITLTSAVLMLPAYVVLRRTGAFADQRRPGWAVLLGLALALSLEFWLGPFSYIGWDCDGQSAAAFSLIASVPAGLQFAHAQTDGIDLTLFSPGQQYVQPEIILARFLPTWVWVALHKTGVALLGLSGAWLLARRILPGAPAQALAAALTFPVAHYYLKDYSIEFGTGFAVLPLAVHVALSPGGRGFWWRVLGTAVLVAVAMPMKVMPALAVATLAGAVMLGVPGGWWRPAAVLAVYVALVLANWHEVLFGLIQAGPLSSRIGAAEGAAPGFQAALTSAVGMGVDTWSSALILAVSLGILALRGAAGRSLRLAGAVAVIVSVFLLLSLIPWPAIGLSMIGALSHGYIRMAFPVVAVLGAALALAACPLPMAGRLAALLAAFAFAQGAWTKLVHAGEMVWLGGQAPLVSHSTLADPSWRSPGAKRAVTLLDAPHPNVTAGLYGIDSFDGGANLVPKALEQYWMAVLLAFDRSGPTLRIGSDWRMWDGRAYHLDRQVDLDLLRAANVGYVLSVLPLADIDGVTLLRAPSSPENGWSRARPDSFPSRSDFLRHRLRRMVDAGEHYVYALDGALPRAWAASATQGATDDAFYPAIARLSRQGIAVLHPEDAGQLPADPAPFSVTGLVRVAEGYDVTVEAPSGGILVLNQNPMPFWRAEADGRPLHIVPVSGVQMAVAIPPATRTVTFRYHRQTLRETVAHKVFGDR